MAYMIFDSAGNAVETFESERAARIELVRLAEQDPAAARSLVVLAFDETGEVVGDAVTVADIAPELAATLILHGEGWTQTRLTVRGSWSWRPDGDPWATLRDAHLAVS